MLLICHTLHITTETLLFLKYFFDGRYGLLLFDAMEMFDADHANDLFFMDRNKGTNLRKTIKLSLK